MYPLGSACEQQPGPGEGVEAQVGLGPPPPGPTPHTGHQQRPSPRVADSNLNHQPTLLPAEGQAGLGVSIGGSAPAVTGPNLPPGGRLRSAGGELTPTPGVSSTRRRRASPGPPPPASPRGKLRTEAARPSSRVFSRRFQTTLVGRIEQEDAAAPVAAPGQRAAPSRPR